MFQVGIVTWLVIFGVVLIASIILFLDNGKHEEIRNDGTRIIDTVTWKTKANDVPILPEINSGNSLSLIDNTSTKDISSHINVSRLKAKSQPDEVEAITPNSILGIEHSSIQSESQITFPSIETHSDKEISIHCETNDSITSITPVTPEQIVPQSEDVPASVTPDITNSGSSHTSNSVDEVSKKDESLPKEEPTSPTETEKSQYNLSANVDLNLPVEQTELLTE
ncbi:4732_t:CDS:2 [Dentiscutata heterogama]|uniref:4732_t:CDS:1 n=1 Tax=Dentiscutata heterogama TaxID=1316150 RepID=A0ACA9K7B1_9GLOM|nr:4732_t:CDS:2 [Dentiscutata heterogama]